MALQLISPPATLPLTLAEAKAHLRIDYTDEDALVTLLIAAATDFIDGAAGFLGRALVDQTWQLVLDTFPTNEIKIPLPPLIAVTSVKYDDAAGNEQTVSSASYTVDDVNEPGWIVPAGTWPTTFTGINAVRITFRAGYVDNGTSPPSGEVPGNIKAAMLLYIGSLYANREEVSAGAVVMPLPWGADVLLRRHRVEVSMA